VGSSTHGIVAEFGHCLAVLPVAVHHNGGHWQGGLSASRTCRAVSTWLRLFGVALLSKSNAGLPFTRATRAVLGMVELVRAAHPGALGDRGST
jgi:hypothetical protein